MHASMNGQMVASQKAPVSRPSSIASNRTRSSSDRNSLSAEGCAKSIPQPTDARALASKKRCSTSSHMVSDLARLEPETKEHSTETPRH